MLPALGLVLKYMIVQYNVMYMYILYAWLYWSVLWWQAISSRLLSENRSQLFHGWNLSTSDSRHGEQNIFTTKLKQLLHGVWKVSVVLLAILRSCELYDNSIVIRKHKVRVLQQLSKRWRWNNIDKKSVSQHFISSTHGHAHSPRHYRNTENTFMQY